MESFLQSLVAPGDFLPHGLCLTWRPELIWTHLLSDILIGLAYFSIPVGLLYFVWQRQDLAYKWIFLMFCGFILACGVIHFFGGLDAVAPGLYRPGRRQGLHRRNFGRDGSGPVAADPSGAGAAQPGATSEKPEILSEMQILERRRA